MASSSRVLWRIGAALGLVCCGATIAAAAPNPLCPGACSGSGQACGAPDDCAEAGACVFADACLPGLAGLVVKVAPDRPGGLNDPNEGWSCRLGRCEIMPTEIAFATSTGIEAAATKAFRVDDGGRVLVRVQLRVAAASWGYAAVVTSDGREIRGPIVIGDATPEWQSLELFVDLASAASGQLTLALHVEGTGAIALREASVLTLRDYDLFVRFELVAPLAPAQFRDRTILRHADSGPVPDFCADGEPAGTEGCLDPAILDGDAAAGAPSAWLPVGRVFAGGRRATHAWEVRDPLSGAPMTGPLTVRTQVAWAPDASAVVWSDERTVGGPDETATIGLVLPEGPPAPSALRGEFGTPAALVAADAAFLPKRQRRPSGFSIGAVVEPGDAFGPTDAVVRAALPILARLGFTVAGFLSEDPSPEAEADALAQGLRAPWIDARALLAALTAHGAIDLDASAAAAPEAVVATIEALLAPETPLGRAVTRAHAGGEAIATLGNAALRGLRIAGPQYRAGFRPWLEANGVTLDALGRASWDAVQPFESTTLDAVRAGRPDPFDAPAARRYVWSVRYWNRANALVLKAIASAFRARDIAFVPLLGSPLGDGGMGGSHLAVSGVDVATLGETDAIDGVMVDATLFGQGDCRPWDLGLVADWAAGFGLSLQDRAGQGARVPLGAYVDVTRGKPTQRLFELAARGFTWFGARTYGPYDFASSEGVGGLGADARDWFAAVAEANDRLAQAEVLLADARRAPSSIVLVASGSETFWRGGPAAESDLVGWHAALSQSQWSVDVLPEAEVGDGAMSHPGRPRHLAFALAPHLSAAAWDKLQSWVEDGGTLVVGPELPLYDAFGTRVFARETWLAAALSERIEAHGATIDWTTTGSLISFPYSGPLRTITSAEGSALGRGDDGDTVALRLRRGRGAVVMLGLDLGRSFLAGATCRNTLPTALARYATGFPASLGRAMGSLPVGAGLARPVAVDRSDVSAHVITSPGGSALLLVSYANGPVDVALTARGLADCQSVTDLVTGEAHALAYGSFSLRLSDVALLTWDRSACEGLAPPTPEAETAETVEPAPPSHDGCSGGGSAAGVIAIALGVLLGARRRSGAPRGSEPR